MNLFGLCTVLSLLTICGVGVCDAECGEYIVVFEETTCSHNKMYKFKQLNLEQINQNNLTYSCNSTDKNQVKKKCLIEFDCMNKQYDCQKHVIPKNFQKHSYIADSRIRKPIINTTEAVAVQVTTDNLVVTQVEATTEALRKPTIAADNHTVIGVESTTETVVLPTTAAVNHTVARVEITTEALSKPTTVADNYTVTLVESTTKAFDVLHDNITVEEVSRRTVHEVFDPTTYDVNIIFIQNSSESIHETSKPRNQELQCKHAEIVCAGEGKPEGSNDTHHYEPPDTLQIEIARDETSIVQPLFTGYFPESSNDSSKNYNLNFHGFMTTSCSILKDSNCKQNIISLKHINIYLQTNYVENNTITKYPNCTNESITPKNELIVKCEDKSFAKHNKHISQGPPSPPKQELWKCQIKELNNTSKEQNAKSKIHFINCSNETNINNKTDDINLVPISDIQHLSGTQKNKTEVSSDKEKTMTIFITENPNNCSHNLTLNINEGKIIDLGLKNNKEKILQNNNVNIILSNCINEYTSKIKNKQPPSKAELIIILKNESNPSNLKQFNGTLKDESVKQRILIECDHTILYLNSNTTNNTTELQCEFIDLDYHNITGIEIMPSRQIINKKTLTKPENETKQEMASWNCIILEEQQMNKLLFGNCSNDENIQDNIKINKTEFPSTKAKLNIDKISQPKHMIKIFITEKENNCSNSKFLSIDKGKIIDLNVNSDKEKIHDNNNIELRLSNCINGKSLIVNETQADLKDLTIILKNEPLNKSDLEQFNGAPRERSVKQRILLQCEHLNRDYRVNTSNITVLRCESIDLDLYNITGILKNDDKMYNKTKVNAVENNDSNIYNKSNEIMTKGVETKEIPKHNIPESNKNNKTKDKYIEIQRNNSKSIENFKNLNFNRRKDIPDGIGQNSLALESFETDKILLIALLSIAGGAILIVIVLRVCSRKKEYNPAPTREPPDDEETAF